jgi:hypothetical protein
VRRDLHEPGYAIVEWFGGYFVEGARVVKDIDCFAMTDLHYDSGSSVRGWVEDFWPSEDDAVETFYDCTS